MSTWALQKAASAGASYQPKSTCPRVYKLQFQLKHANSKNAPVLGSHFVPEHLRLTQSSIQADEKSLVIITL